MFVDITEIKNAAPGNTFRLELKEKIDTLSVENDEIKFLGPLDISLEVTNTGKIIIVSGKIKGNAELLCYRCLEKFPYHLDTGFEQKFCHVSEFASISEEGLDPDEILTYDGYRIELDDVIRESIVLGLPMKFICMENCKGLCKLCGTNLNKKDCGCTVDDIDPRLEVLKNFFERQ